MGALSTRFVGKSIARKEDARFLTGHGRFVDDITLPTCCTWPSPAATWRTVRIVSIDTSAAEALPGVVAVFLAADINPRVLAYTPDDEMGAERPFRALADGDVRCVGEPYAMVVAESRYVAEDAVELIEVDFDPLPAVVDMEQGAGRRRAGRAPRARHQPLRHVRLSRGSRARGGVRQRAGGAHRDVQAALVLHRAHGDPRADRELGALRAAAQRVGGHPGPARAAQRARPRASASTTARCG